MAFKIPFIQASQFLTSVKNKTKNYRKIGREYFASVLIARHNGEDQEGKKFPKKVKILNNLKIQKHM